jgi:hypothetical protein
MDIIITASTITDVLGITSEVSKIKKAEANRKWAAKNLDKLAENYRAYYHNNPEAAERKRIYARERYHRLKMMKSENNFI